MHLLLEAPRFRRATGLLALVALALVPAAAPGKAPAKQPAKQQAGAKADAAPSANAAGVLKVFGVDGKEPRVWPDNGKVWKKDNQKVQGRTAGVSVTLAYTDLEIAKGEKRIFASANPFKLPNGIYTYVILRDGTTSFGHPLDVWEVGTRHAHLAQGRPVVGSGELLKSNSALKLNLLSGTFMIPLIKNQKVPNAAFLEKRIEAWFDKVLRAKYKAPASFKVVFDHKGEGTYDNQIIFDSKLKPPTEQALSKLCANQHFKGNNAELCETAKAGTGGGKAP